MSKRSSPQQQRILDVLRAHPFLSATQMSWQVHQSGSAVKRLLWQLQRKRSVRRYPLFVETERKTQWLYTLTAKGLETLARIEHLSLRGYQEKYGYSISRLRWLALVLERVYQTREMLRYVVANNPGGWVVAQWSSETEIRYETAKGWRRLTFQCSAILVNQEQRWVPLMIEWDSGDVPIEAQHAYWKSVLLAQDDAEFDYSSDYHFPVLIYVGKDVQRFVQFIDLIEKIRAERPRPSLPYAYLTHRNKLADTLVWFDTERGDWGAQVLASCKGNTDKPWVFWKNRPLRQSYANAQVDIEPLSPDSIPQATLHNIASLALVLRPLEKKLVSAVGSHPLLTASELAFVIGSAPSKVWQAVSRLTRWKLIKAHACRVPMQHTKRWDQVHVYTLSDIGLVYLAAAAGLGTTPKRIALARGWEKGFDAPVYHTDHTRIGNELFLQLLAYARTHNYPMTWYSEQEARLYFNLSRQEWSGPYQTIRLSPVGNHRQSEREEENAGEHEGAYTVEGSYGNRKEFWSELARHGTRFRRFLPDGRAVLQVGGAEWHIAVEIDLTRANYRKMIAKFNYYYMLFDFHLDAPNLRILMVTHHWQRAQNLYWLAWQRATEKIDHARCVDLHLRGRPWAEVLAIAEKHLPQELCNGVLPIYITTVAEFRKHGMDQPIWLRVQEKFGKDGYVNHSFTKTQCLEHID